MTEANRAEVGAPSVNDAADLVAQLRDLAGPDPAGVQQVVTEVLAALDRASGGALRDHLPGNLHLPGGPEDADLASGRHADPAG